MTPFFSILVPVYNQAGKMDRCYESLKNQTFTDYEVICVDDGSTDSSWEMLMSYTADPHFKALRHEKNSSLVAARYTGMKAAQGQYCLFVDSDDYVETNMLEVLHKALSGAPADILRFGFMFESNGSVRTPLQTDDPFAAMLEEKEIAALWKRVYSREVIQKALEKTEPFYCNMGEDTYFSSVFFTLAKTNGAIDDVLYHYFDGTGMSGGNQAISVVKLRRDLKSAHESSSHTLAFLEENDPSRVAKARAAVRFISRYILWAAFSGEPDLVHVVDLLRLIKEEYDEDLYLFGCRKLLENKIKTDLEGADLSMKYKGLKQMLLEEVADRV